MNMREYQLIQDELSDLLRKDKLRNKGIAGKRLEGYVDGVKAAKSILHYRNPVRAARGKWTIDGKCSVCGEEPLTEFDVELMNYCPNCGEYMGGQINV